MGVAPSATAGAYRVSAFFSAKSITTAPVEVLQILFFAIVVYFMTGYQATASKFFIYYVTLALFALTSETIGHLCAIVTKSSHNGAVPIHSLDAGSAAVCLDHTPRTMLAL